MSIILQFKNIYLHYIWDIGEFLPAPHPPNPHTQSSWKLLGPLFLLAEERGEITLAGFLCLFLLFSLSKADIFLDKFAYL